MSWYHESGGSGGGEWLYSCAGETSGPVSAEQLQQLVDDGVVRPQHHVRHLRWDRWWSVADAAPTIGLTLNADAEQSAPAQADDEAPQASDPDARETPPPSSDDADPVPPDGNEPAPPVDDESLQAPEPVDDEPDAATAATSTASFGIRAASWTIDAGVVLVFALVANAFFADAAPAVPTLLSVAAFVGYFYGLVHLGHDRLGHRLLGLTVRDYETGEEIDRYAAAARTAILALLALPLLLGLIGSLLCSRTHPEHRAWHDLLTGSTVTRSS